MENNDDSVSIRLYCSLLSDKILVSNLENVSAYIIAVIWSASPYLQPQTEDYKQK